MADFKFSCPQCHQNILCDTAYAGRQINCPSCQRLIVVPSSAAIGVAPAGTDGVMQIKKTTLRTAALILLAVLLLTGIGWGAFYFWQSSHKVTFRAYVDGSEMVKLRGNELWIEHLTWQLPAKISVNGKNWEPTWDEDSSPNFPSWQNNNSAHYKISTTFHPGNPKSIKITKVAGRGVIRIAQKPLPTNEQTLGILVDDGPQGGADWYEFTVSW